MCACVHACVACVYISIVHDMMIPEVVVIFRMVCLKAQGLVSIHRSGLGTYVFVDCAWCLWHNASDGSSIFLQTWHGVYK